MNDRPFVDYYEVLQLSPSATTETLERVYRLLAKRYHPDNQTTGETAKFAEVHEAYQVLSNPESRAQYDVRYDENRSMQWKIFDQGSAADGREADRRIFNGILSLLYIARRQDPHGGGLGAINLEKMLGVPSQHLEFPIWYMRQKGWIKVMDSGQYGITVEGIDKLSDRDMALREDRLLPESSLGSEPANRGHRIGDGVESRAGEGSGEEESDAVPTQASS